MKSTLSLCSAGICAFGLVSGASAESSFVTTPTTGTQTATARLDFRVTVPRFIYLRVGTGNAVGAANNTTINLIDFTVPAAAVGTNTAAAPMAANGVGAANQGDLGAGTVTARLTANGWSATASLSATATGALGNGAGDSIDYAKISVVSAPLTGVTGVLTHPATLSNGASAFSGVTATTGTRVIDRGAQWTFAYANDAVVPSGVYGQTSSGLGAAVNNGRIVYTATMP